MNSAASLLPPTMGETAGSSPRQTTPGHASPSPRLASLPSSSPSTSLSTPPTNPPATTPANSRRPIMQQSQLYQPVARFPPRYQAPRLSLQSPQPNLVNNQPHQQSYFQPQPLVNRPAAVQPAPQVTPLYHSFFPSPLRLPVSPASPSPSTSSAAPAVPSPISHGFPQPLPIPLAPTAAPAAPVGSSSPATKMLSDLAVYNTGVSVSTSPVTAVATRGGLEGSGSAGGTVLNFSSSSPTTPTPSTSFGDARKNTLRLDSLSFIRPKVQPNPQAQPNSQLKPSEFEQPTFAVPNSSMPPSFVHSSTPSASESSTSAFSQSSLLGFPPRISPAPLPTVEHTPNRFLASCSNVLLDMEPNPFEDSFGVSVSDTACSTSASNGANTNYAQPVPCGGASGQGAGGSGARSPAPLLPLLGSLRFSMSPKPILPIPSGSRGAAASKIKLPPTAGPTPPPTFTSLPQPVVKQEPAPDQASVLSLALPSHIGATALPSLRSPPILRLLPSPRILQPQPDPLVRGPIDDAAVTSSGAGLIEREPALVGSACQEPSPPASIGAISEKLGTAHFSDAAFVAAAARTASAIASRPAFAVESSPKVQVPAKRSRKGDEEMPNKSEPGRILGKTVAEEFVEGGSRVGTMLMNVDINPTGEGETPPPASSRKRFNGTASSGKRRSVGKGSTVESSKARAPVWPGEVFDDLPLKTEPSADVSATNPLLFNETPSVVGVPHLTSAHTRFSDFSSSHSQEARPHPPLTPPQQQSSDGQWHSTKPESIASNTPPSSSASSTSSFKRLRRAQSTSAGENTADSTAFPPALQETSMSVATNGSKRRRGEQQPKPKQQQQQQQTQKREQSGTPLPLSPTTQAHLRRLDFRERNRRAASKCRQKRKLWVQGLEQSVEDIQRENESLEEEIEVLKGIVEGMKGLAANTGLACKECARGGGGGDVDGRTVRDRPREQE
ncbi:hypothetical protein DFJ73DRAFT_859156 [Zopfochytrium polystomum]|nr:hypothetical protein DFJ73DRAFT_859156 [Zopfochytrium polystomum]